MRAYFIGSTPSPTFMKNRNGLLSARSVKSKSLSMDGKFADACPQIANLHRACLAVEIVGNYMDRSNGNASPNGCRQPGAGTKVPYPLVSQGVNAIQSGDTLYVRGGNYNQTLRITKPMTIRNYAGSISIGRP